MRRWRICDAQEVEGRDKPFWNEVGTILEKDNGRLSVYLPIFGRWYNAFPIEDKPRDQGQRNEPPRGDDVPF